MENNLAEIRSQMEKLGCRGAVRIRPLDAVRVQVLYHGGVFGIYDFIRHTFVD